jgi:hypothetical protein
MKRALSVFVFLLLPAAAFGQQAWSTFDASPQRSGRSPFFVGPSYRTSQDAFRPAVQPMTGLSARSSVGGNAWGGVSSNVTPNITGVWRPSTFSHNPYYPNVSLTPTTDMRPDEYVIPPVTQTPLHDPYFEERVYDPYVDDPYDVWGW